MTRSRYHSLTLLVCVAMFIQGVATAQDQLKVDIETPKGWRTETLSLPTGFAKDMKLTGFEEVRFAPGMFRPDAEDFFTYCFVFCLPDQTPPNEKTLTLELLKYYRGLAVAVTRRSDIDVKPDSFTLKITPVKDSKTKSRAVMTWVEPFATQKPQTLNLEIESVLDNSIKGCLLKIAVSPKPSDSEVWKPMRRMLKEAKVTVTERRTQQQ
ncbi:MAG: hypothetical protein O2945_20020 [Planctomycetota bacterium]|nr:hypothetical protein [Planctomycetota bacterium]